MLLNRPYHHQPQHAVRIRPEFSKYLRAGAIASTKQGFVGSLDALADSRVVLSGIARGSVGSTLQDTVSFDALTSDEKNLPLVNAGEIVGWSHTSDSVLVIEAAKSSHFTVRLQTRYISTTRYLEVTHRASSGAYVTTTNQLVPIIPGESYKFCAFWDTGNELVLWVNGVKATTSTSETGCYSSANIANLGTGGGGGREHPYLSMFFFAGLFSKGELSNDLYGYLIEPRRIFIMPAAASAAALEGDAVAQATASGDLTTDIPLTGVSVVVATATGSLNVPIDLSGNAAAVSSAAASLTTAIPLDGDAAGSANATADMSAEIPLGGNAAGQSTAAANMTATITLSGAALVNALVNAGIDTSILLGANAAGQATVTGALDGDSNIAGNAQASVSATGSLDTAIDMSGSAQGSANSTGWIVKAGGTLDDLYDSMGDNAAGVVLENNPVFDWTKKGIVGMGNRGRGPATPTAWAPADTSYKTLDPWAACVAWFVIWPGVNHAANNTGVNIKHIQFWVKRISDGQWYLANSGNIMPSWPNPASGVSYRVEADGSRSYFLDGARNSNGVAIHGGTPRFSIDGDDIECVYVSLEARLVLDDESGQNDMQDAELFYTVGSDYWPDMSSAIGDFAPMTYMPAVGNSRFERALTSPRITQFATIDPPGDNSGYTFVGARSVSRATFESNLPPPLMPFAADAVAQATASGDLTTGIPLDADAASQATVSGDISGAAQLAGAANAAATATGNLTIQIQLSADAVAQALATASLDNPINLDGQVSSNAAATGELTTQINMDADAQSQSTATGQLAASDVPLAGNASATASGQGDLNTAITLDGAALNVVSGTGSLTVNLGISGHAAALVAAGADLTTQIPLNAAAVAEVLSTANLSGGVSTLKPNPKYTVIAPWRNYRVAA